MCCGIRTNLPSCCFVTVQRSYFQEGGGSFCGSGTVQSEQNVFLKAPQRNQSLNESAAGRLNASCVQLRRFCSILGQARENPKTGRRTKMQIPSKINQQGSGAPVGFGTKLKMLKKRQVLIHSRDHCSTHYCHITTLCTPMLPPKILELFWKEYTLKKALFV